MTSWFSATAITPELRDTWKLSEPFLVWLTNGVQIGFVIGALASSLVNLPDIIRLNRLMAASAAMAAVANAIADATGIRLRDLPMSPPRLLAALDEAEPMRAAAD